MKNYFFILILLFNSFLMYAQISKKVNKKIPYKSQLLVPQKIKKTIDVNLIDTKMVSKDTLIKPTENLTTKEIKNNENDLLSMLGEEEEKQTNYTIASFKTTRVINGHSLESASRGVLDTRINHRFDYVKNGLEDLFGLDDANIRIGIDYGITDNLTVGLGRNSYDKVVDGFVKYKILRQSTGKKNIPITLAILSNLDLVTTTKYNPDLSDYFWTRAYFTNQIIIGSKLNESTSLQFMPTHVHRNFVNTEAEKNDVFILGIAGRQKLTKRLAINAEYYYALPDQLADNIKNSLSIGFDIETGGHVFQLFFSNSIGTDHRGFLTETTGNWSKGDITFGFNISRVFTLSVPKELRKK